MGKFVQFSSKMGGGGWGRNKMNEKHSEKFEQKELKKSAKNWKVAPPPKK